MTYLLALLAWPATKLAIYAYRTRRNKGYRSILFGPWGPGPMSGH